MTIAAAQTYDPHAAELSTDTFLCRADDGSAVVLKRLEDDCLHAGRLHPLIRQRLSLVRGVAHPRLATLRGVERTGGVPFLVWSFVAGQPVADLHGLEAPTAAAVFRAIIAAVRTLHARGLVHGAIHPHNVIRTDTGDLWLTHVSPYLYDDPAADFTAVLATIESIAIRSPQVRLPWTADAIPSDLEELDGLLTRLASPPGDAGSESTAHTTPTDPPDPRPPRWRWLVTAAALAAIAAAVGVVTSRRLAAPTGFSPPIVSKP